MAKKTSIEQFASFHPLNKEYEVFSQCAEILNISRTAEVLGMQQAGLSKLIKRLEDELGFALFIRRNSGLELTQEGAKLQKVLRKAQGFIAETIKEEFSDSDQPTGSLIVGCNSSLAIDLVPRIFPQMLQEFPKISIETQLGRSAEISRRVSQLEIDVGFVINAVNSPELVCKKLETHFLAGFAADANHEPVLVYNPETFQGPQHLKKFKGYQCLPIKDYEVMGTLVKASRFVGLLPNTVAQRFGLSLVTPKILSVELSMIYHKEKMKSFGRKKIVDFILQKLS